MRSAILPTLINSPPQSTADRGLALGLRTPPAATDCHYGGLLDLVLVFEQAQGLDIDAGC